jgi:hypothetical protein
LVKELQGLGLRVDLIDEGVEVIDAEQVIASAGPADKTVPSSVISDDDDTETVLDEADDIDLEEDGLNIETAEEFKEEEA